MELTERQKAMLLFLEVPRTRRELMAAFNLSVQATNTALEKLTRAGLITGYRADPTGRGPPPMLFKKKAPEGVGFDDTLRN